ncbi:MULTISPECIES: hypothetical protein [Microbacterium]|uniref:DUF7882 domain-containing protein n=1 Tax=Microbacterium wangchenii TaxID=2541726 RepID=A0ABX5SRM2_9MICO|nr:MULTISPECIES: hypothetical protein [Microbacterium]MCK6068217.1 hypothetical protein [Microbacterium sp. EYE_512]QBR87504.1 hypothetical protein E4K62_01625 [Microbacterium wangchenii]TXK15773.1 hypothetical protein FVP99_09725 [Microbacterium wangchenii]
MGKLRYGGTSDSFTIEDRTLAHVKVVITTKLRRGESFTLSWRHSDDQPVGRTTLWMHPSIPVRFEFDNPEPEALSGRWLKSLAESANSSGGLMLIPEPSDSSHDQA